MATSYSNTGGTGDRRALIPMASTGTWFGTVNNLIDGTQGDGTSFAFGAATEFTIQFDFDAIAGSGTKVVIDEATWYQSTPHGHGDFQWEGSNDASAWSVVGSSFPLGGTLTQTMTSLAGNATAYRYYRLKGVSGFISGSPQLREIEFKIEAAGPPPASASKPIALFLSNIDETNYVLAGRMHQPVEWSMALDQTGSARWTMGGINGPWLPRVGQFFVIYDTGIPGWGGTEGRIIAGSIDSVTPESPTPVIVPNYIQVSVTGSSLEHTFQRRLVRPDLASTLFKNEYAGYIAYTIAQNFLVDDGVIADIANFEPGPLVEFVAFNHQTVAECFTQLAEQADFHWYIRPTGHIYFQPREAEFAPWGIVAGAMNCDRLSIRESRENLSNAVYVRTLFGPSVEGVVTSIAGQRFFQISEQIGEVLNLATGPVEARVPVEFATADGTDKPFFYIPGDDGIWLTTGVADLPVGTIVTINYNAFGGDVVHDEDPDAIAIRASLEGTSGRYELAVGSSANTSRETSEQRASMIIQQRGNLAHVVEGETKRRGLEIGQAIVINTFTPPINDTFLITDISGRILPGTDKIVYNFTGVNGPKLPTGWDFFTGLGDTGYGGGFGAGFSQAASGAGTAGSGNGQNLLADLWREVPVGVIDGTNTDFYLTHTVRPPWSLELKLNQVTQNPISNAVQAGPIPEYLYTLEGNKITYRYAPQPGDVHDASYWRGKPTSTVPTYTFVYWRLLIFNNSGGQVASVAEWKFYDGGGSIIPTTGGTASGSEVYNPAANAFDGNPATDWRTSPGSNPQPAAPEWLQYQFPIAISPATFTITANNSTEFYYVPDSFALQGSDDGAVWTTIGNYTGGPWSLAGETREYTVAAVGFGDFYRIYLTSTASLDHYSIPELVFMDEGGAALSLVNGQAMAGGTYISNNCGPSLAFDGNAATFWRSFGVSSTNPQWLGYRFAGAVTVGSFSIRTRDSIFYGEAPLTFRLEKSTDGGSTWTVIQSYTTPTWTAGEIRTFTVD